MYDKVTDLSIRLIDDGIISSAGLRIKTEFMIPGAQLFCNLVPIMKLLLIVVLAVAATALPVEETKPEIEPEHDYILFPDGDGVPHIVDLNEKVPEQSPEEIERNVNTITFNLFTRNNPTNRQVLTLNSISTVHNSNFRNNRPTRFVTHGWRSSQNSDACVLVRNAYLAAGDYNVIVVDWSNIAGQLYGPASSNVRNVAARVSEFINFMRNQAGLNLGTTKLVGHSLGGHIAGIAARGANGNVQGVIALDPASPGFENAGAGSSVHPNDANHVQVIHTNAGLLGLSRNAGNSDFWPNGGRSQPGCGLDLVGSCAHGRAYQYFAESIRNPTGFRANGVNGVFMGGRSLTNANGRFEVTTRGNAPFAMG